MKSLFLLLLLVPFLLAGCGSLPEQDETRIEFLPVPREQSRITFTNDVKESPDLNYFTYQYMYNGGGVAVGDINNDGLPDLYFSANQLHNALYLNMGAFSFEDITAHAGVTADSGWNTGVSMVDIDADGYLDIYVCRSGNPSNPDLRKNLLYINNQNNTFTNRAHDFGLDDAGFSTQAYFYDYDKDGDLDLYLVNHRVDFENTVLLGGNFLAVASPYQTDKLYRNNGNGTFTDVSTAAGIENNAWGLGAAVGDFNNDGWDDVYVTNDFMEPDFLYINNGDGTFSERLKEFIKHTSFYGMGCDIGDVNNDGYDDLVVLDMVSADRVRSKRNMASMSTSNFWKMVRRGHHYQFMSNTLQLNNGNGSFSEIAQLAGIAKTDWSWAPLLADFDNDGWQDLFVTNGIKRDVTDNDFRRDIKKVIAEKGSTLLFDDVMNMIPSTRVQNVIFRNNGDLTFENVGQDWNITESMNSNGAVYADLDRDGDLDLVVNNLDAPASVYENRVVKGQRRDFLQIRLQGPQENKFGIGAKVSLTANGSTQYQRLAIARGYQSSVEPLLHFGLGASSTVGKLVVDWPDGKQNFLSNISANQMLTIRYADAQPARFQQNVSTPTFVDITDSLGIHYRHRENAYDDFAKELLLPHKQSQYGPLISTGDINSDGFEDFYVGGAAGYPGSMFVQNQNERFEVIGGPWEHDKASEDLGSLLFDADGDGDLDLYVVSGGNEFPENSPLLQDRLYLNNGKGTFSKTTNSLPKMFTSGLRVVAGDYDLDGDLDLFVGGRIIPGRYPLPPRSYLLRNDGGKFSDVTESVAPELLTPGLVTDALFTDYDNDGDPDLIVTGEWMSIHVFENTNGAFKDRTQQSGLGHLTGWWFSLASGDFDNDGDIDFIAGNIGKNVKYKASETEPLQIYCADFDNNGTLDIVLGQYQQGVCYPVRGRECSSEQMSFIKEKFPTYKGFAEASIEKVYSEEELKSALRLEATELRSCFVRNDGNGTFTLHPLPNQAQISPINGMVVLDVNHDGNLDIVTAGNMYGAEVETIRYDSGIGVCLLGNGKGEFSALSFSQSGFFADGDVKQLRSLNLGREKKKVLLVARNNDMLKVFAPLASGIQKILMN